MLFLYEPGSERGTIFRKHVFLRTLKHQISQKLDRNSQAQMSRARTLNQQANG